MKHGSIAAAAVFLLVFMGAGFYAMAGDAQGYSAKAVAEATEPVVEVADRPMPAAEPVLDMGMEGFGESFVPYEPPVEEEEEWYEEGWYGYYEEPVYYYEDYYYEPPYDTSDGISAEEFKFMGVVEDGGTRYTWYSQNVLPGGGLDELNANGRHVEGGYVVDGDGYIAVASSDHEKGEVIDTPFGEAKVYDTGCASGTVDVYTSF